MTNAGRRTLTSLAVGALALSAAACTSSDPDRDGGPTGASVITSATASPSTGTGGTPTGSATTSAPRPTLAPTGTVASGVITTRPPVPISSPVDFGRGVTARITRVRAVTAKANLPGEISGPAVTVTIRLTNDSRRAAAVEPVVNLYYGSALTPASTIDGTPSTPFGARIGAGDDATGTYTFTLAASQRMTVRIEFSYTPTAPVVLWQGSVS